MLCYHLFCFYVDITNTEDYISTIYKGLKAIKLPTFVLLCGIKFYVYPTQPFLSLWGVYPHRFFLTVDTKIEFYAIK